MSNPGDIISGREALEQMNKQMAQVVEDVNANFTFMQTAVQEAFNRVKEELGAIDVKIEQLGTRIASLEHHAQHKRDAKPVEAETPSTWDRLQG